MTGNRDDVDTTERGRDSYDGPHEHDESRDDASGEAGSGVQHDDSEPSPYSGAESAGQRSQDREVGGSERELSATHRDVDSSEEVIEGEVLDQPGSRRVDAVIAHWRGELPHPDDAERYEAISPGTFDRLVALNERRLSVVEKDQELAATRESTVRTAVEAEAEVKRELATADTDALERGQWMSWSISSGALAIAVLGLLLHQPFALTAVLVPVVQVGAQLVRTVTRDRSEASTGSSGEAAFADPKE